MSDLSAVARFLTTEREENLEMKTEIKKLAVLGEKIEKMGTLGKEISEAVVITAEMLKQAGFSDGMPISAVVSEGGITLRESEPLDFVPCELREIFEAFGLSDEVVEAVLLEDNGILDSLILRQLAVSVEV
jgi:antitoxin component of MazEF toxin-antitoxin module